MANRCLAVSLGKAFMEGTGLKAVDIIKQISPLIKGGGGGQPDFATAGGKEPGGMADALEEGGGVTRVIGSQRKSPAEARPPRKDMFFKPWLAEGSVYAPVEGAFHRIAGPCTWHRSMPSS
jgi:hypothetical protein